MAQYPLSSTRTTDTAPRMKPKTLFVTTAVIVLALAGPGGAGPKDDVSGSYALSGKIGWYGPSFDATLSLNRLPSGAYEVKRRSVMRLSGEVVERAGTATVETVQMRADAPEGEWAVKVRLKVVFPPVKGASDALADAMGEAGAQNQELTGTYTVQDTGSVGGWVQMAKPDGSVTQVYESGERGAGGEGGEEPAPAEGGDAPRLIRPAAGVYLVGSELLARAAKPGDTVEVVGGPARLDDPHLVLTGSGEVKLRARRGERAGPVRTIRVVAPRVTRIKVLNTIVIVDAKPPHYAKALGEEAKARQEPAAILQNRRLELEVTLQGEADLSGSTVVQLTGRDGDDLILTREVELKALKTGQTVALRTTTPLNAAVAVNALELSWTLTAEGDARIGKTPLRVYTTHGAPVTNPIPRYAPARRGYATNTKLHFELACTWANGASTNTGNGADSIGHQVDNQFRHLVHPQDYGEGGEFAPFVPHYPQGAEPPSNYAKLPGTVNAGRRGVSKIYYPSVGREDWTPYRNNFGWWVIETTGIAGGRCNQQASCISDILGTLGISAKVYYIERTATGKRSGRPMRRHYRSNISGALWNFHGMCEAVLSDGTRWLYDGSGSRPPNRTNGKTEDLMTIDGKYVKYWAVWRYDDGEDGNWFAPLDEWPDTWHGVPLQAGETALDPNAPDGTYVQKLGSGKLPDPTSETPDATKRRTFYVVNVQGKMVTKVDAGTPEAETYQSSVHGSITDWIKH